MCIGYKDLGLKVQTHNGTEKGVDLVTIQMRLVADVGFEYLDGGPEIAEQADGAADEALVSLAKSLSCS